MFVPADSKEQIILVVKSAKMLDNLNSSFYEYIKISNKTVYKCQKQQLLVTGYM